VADPRSTQFQQPPKQYDYLKLLGRITGCLQLVPVQSISGIRDTRRISEPNDETTSEMGIRYGK